MSHPWADNRDCTVQPKANSLTFSQAWERSKVKFQNQEGLFFFFFCVMLLSDADLFEALVFIYRGEI